MKLDLKVLKEWSDWATIGDVSIETDDYKYFILETRGKDSEWYLIGYRWVWKNAKTKTGEGWWFTDSWYIQYSTQAVLIYQKIPDKIKTINSYYKEVDGVKMFIDELIAKAISNNVT